MKQVLTLFALTAVLVQLAFAEAQTQEEIVQNVVDNLKNDERNGAEPAVAFAQSVKSVTKFFVQQKTAVAAAAPQNINSQLETSIDEFVSSTQGLRTTVLAEIAIIANGVKRTTFTQAANELAKTNSSAVAFQSFMSGLRDNADENVQSQLDTINADWNKWSTSQQRIFSKKVDNDESAVTKAKENLNEFVERLEGYLQGCADEVTSDVEAFEAKVQTAIDGYKSNVNELEIEVQNCLDSDYRPAANVACRNGVRPIVAKLARAPQQLRKFQTDGDKLQKVQITKRACVVQAQAQFKSESYFVQRSLNKLVDEYKENKENADANTTPSG